MKTELQAVPGKSGTYLVMRDNEAIGEIGVCITTWRAVVFARAEAGAMVVERDSARHTSQHEAHKWVAGRFWDDMRAHFGLEWEQAN